MMTRLNSLILQAADVYLRRRYRHFLDREARYRDTPLDHASLALPRSADEKFLWRRMVDHNPDFVTLTDKVLSKQWLAQHFPDLPLPKTLWTGTDPRDIPKALWKQRMVLKPTHRCGDIYFHLPGKTRPHEIRKALRCTLRKRYGGFRNQWAYAQLNPGLIAEEWVGPNGAVLDELKIFTFGSEISRVVHLRDRFGRHQGQRWIVGTDGLLMNDSAAVAADHPLHDDLPPCIDQVMDAARRIGAAFDHMRVDVHVHGSRFWIGEITVYNLGGSLTPVGSEHDGYEAGLWDLRRSWFLRARHRNPAARLYARALRARLDQMISRSR